MKKIYAFLWFFSCVLGVKAQSAELIINEVMVGNIDMFIDPSNNYGSWIELYNPGSSSFVISSRYISDDPDNLQKFKIPSTIYSVPAGKYKTIYFDHNGDTGNYGTNAKNNVNFKLDPEGGRIYISDVMGNILAQCTYPASIPRCSFARTTDAGFDWAYTCDPTPGATNMTSTFADERLAAPVPSCSGGIFAPGQTQTMTVEVPLGAELYYTTDGSTPSRANGSLSTSLGTQHTFTIDTTTVYRFICFRNGYLPSPVVTRSFIFKTHDFYLPIVSVVTDPKHLYDNTLGIYCTGTNGISGKGQSTAKNWNMDWERPVNMELMIPEQNSDGETVFVSYLNQELDMEICGGWSRAWGGGTTDGKTWEMKSSFRLKCDKRYEGVNSLDYRIFPHKPYNKYKVWQIRNGGNDSYNRMIDPAVHLVALESEFYLDAQDIQPAHIFFNGEYLGMLNIRESNNRHFAYSNYGIDSDDVDQFELSGGYKQMVGTNAAWLTLINLASKLATDQSADTYQQICERLDIDEYVNFMAYECFLGPSDWLTNTNNVKGFCCRSDGGKFHFVMFDTDSAFDSSDMTRSVINLSGGANVDDLFRYLMKYPPFVRRYVDAFCLVSGSLYNVERTKAIVDRHYDLTNLALTFEGNSSSKDVASRMKSAATSTSRLANLRSLLGLSSPYVLDLSCNTDEARMFINGQLVPTGRFSGQFFNYNDMGIYITAKAPSGYSFSGWYKKPDSGSAAEAEANPIPSDATWYYYDQGSLDGQAWNELGYEPARNGWKQGVSPLGYASSGRNMYDLIHTTISYGDDSDHKTPTYYFIKDFTLPEGPSNKKTYQMNYQVDDGCRIFVNGHLVASYNLSETASYSKYSDTYTGDTPYDGTFEIPLEYLQQGTNVVAVDVHNNSATSSDIFFNATLLVIDNDAKDGFTELFTTDESFLLTRSYPVGTYAFRARYSPIEGARERIEAGSTPVRINEVSAGNDIHINELFKKKDWVELYNTTDADIDLGGMYMSDTSKKPQKWQMPVGTIIGAHSTLVIWCDQATEAGSLHAPFKLDNADGACVSIQAKDGSWADRLQYLEQPRWQTYGRYPNGGAHSTLFTQPTIDSSNHLGYFDFTTVASEDYLDDELTITLALAKGWNWTSHNLAENVHRSRFTSYAQCILSQNDSCWCNPDALVGTSEASAWEGTLNTLDAAAGYKLQLASDAEISLRGKLFAAATTSVELEEGWNWLGFPLYNATTLEAAFADHSPSEGDVIVGIDQFSCFENGEWNGTLTSLQPGQAYLYRSARPYSFCWTALSPAKERRRTYRAPRATSDAPWTLDIHAYPNVYPIVANIVLEEGVTLTEPYYVGAFCGDECRGVASLVDGLFYMNVHGTEGETITFRLFETDGNDLQSTNNIVMHPMAVLGCRENPFQINFTERKVDNDDYTVISAAQLAVKVVSTRFYNLQGQALTAPSGICIRRTTYADGHSIVEKVMYR